MPNQQEIPPARGDEAELFRSYNPELVRRVASRVHTRDAHTVEDACSFAWTMFLQEQPDRQRNWRGWLTRTAERQAWFLERHGGTSRRSVRVASTEVHEERAHDSAQRRNPIDTWVDLNDAMSVIRELPETLQRVAMMRALGLMPKDIGHLTGDSETRINRLVVKSNDHIWSIKAQRETPSRAGRSPRADRLRQ